MALSITSVTRINGPACDHVSVTINREGTVDTFRTSFSEVDAAAADLIEMAGGGIVGAARVLAVVWARYRRFQGRAITGVNVA